MDGSSTAEEASAFLHWIQGIAAQDAFEAQDVQSLEDLSNGAVLFEILSRIDESHFRNPHGAEDSSDNIVIKIGTLKRLYKLILQYVSEVMRLSVQELEEPDLDALARIAPPSEVCKVCRLVLCISVQSDKKMTYIGIIQGLSQEDQQQLMLAIEQTMSLLRPVTSGGNEDGDDSIAEKHDRNLSESSSTKSPKKERNGDQLAVSYQKLVAEHEAQQATIEALELDMAKLQGKLDETVKELESERRNNTSAEQKNDVQRLTEELRKCEEALATAEADIDRLQQNAKELNRDIEEAQKKASQYDAMKDQLDEYKHAADKLRKAESVIDKYKKKLEEGADLRRKIKELEDQNAELIDRTTMLQDEQSKVANFKPLMESYKTQVSELETRASNLQKHLDATNFEKDQIEGKLKTSEAARASDKEELELYQERVKELELGNNRASSETNTAPPAKTQNGVAGDHEAEDSLGLDEELDDALSGTSMTDLKIQLRRLKRERDAAVANKADVSRILVLENLLEDAQQMKARYETDYLAEHQAKLVLSKQLEDIRGGRSDLGDGVEANIALRSRLNEVVEELDSTKKELVSLKVEHEATKKELTIASSDLSLVNRDQIDVLRELRASVDKEKEGLESQVSRLNSEVEEAKERNNMLMQQVNGLLLDKVNLQTQHIGHRDEALRRERNLGELKASLAGKALPKEAEDLIQALQLSQANSEAQAKSLQDKLNKARTFIRQQDQLLKERATNEEVASEGVLQQELKLMTSAFQDVSLRLAHELHSASRGRRNMPFRPSSSWLGQQRRAGGARLV